MLLASGYPPGHTSRPHLLPFTSSPRSLQVPPTPLRPSHGQPLSLHEVRRPCPPLSRGRCRVEP